MPGNHLTNLVSIKARLRTAQQILDRYGADLQWVGKTFPQIIQLWQARKGDAPLLSNLDPFRYIFVTQCVTGQNQPARQPTLAIGELAKDLLKTVYGRKNINAVHVAPNAAIGQRNNPDNIKRCIC
jgi:hypothetical protein